MRKLDKIISGGQTGADQAALDTAIKFNIPHGGWIIKGRRTESGPLPERYRLKEMDATDYPTRTRQNIIDSDGTLIVSRGPLTGGSKLTDTFARELNKPNLHINLLNQDIFEASLILKSFIVEYNIAVLNVAGPRASHDPGIYHDVKSVIESVLYLDYLEWENDNPMGEIIASNTTLTTGFSTLDHVLESLTCELTLRGKTLIARIKNRNIGDIYFFLLDHIKERTGMNDKDSLLFKTIASNTDLQNYTPEDGVMDIVKALKTHLDRDYNLRIVS